MKIVHLALLAILLMLSAATLSLYNQAFAIKLAYALLALLSFSLLSYISLLLFYFFTKKASSLYFKLFVIKSKVDNCLWTDNKGGIKAGFNEAIKQLTNGTKIIIETSKSTTVFKQAANGVMLVNLFNMDDDDWLEVPNGRLLLVQSLLNNNCLSQQKLKDLLHKEQDNGFVKVLNSLQLASVLADDFLSKKALSSQHLNTQKEQLNASNDFLTHQADFLSAKNEDLGGQKGIESYNIINGEQQDHRIIDRNENKGVQKGHKGIKKGQTVVFDVKQKKPNLQKAPSNVVSATSSWTKIETIAEANGVKKDAIIKRIKRKLNQTRTSMKKQGFMFENTKCQFLLRDDFVKQLIHKSIINSNSLTTPPLQDVAA